MHYSSTYTRRTALTLDSAGATADFDVTIPPEWDDFWTTIDSSANNLRVVWYDGKTVLNYAVDNGSGSSFDKTNRLGRIRLDGVAVPATAGMVLIYLYWAPTSNQSSGAVAVTMTSVRNGYIELGRPGQDRFEHRPQSTTLTRPHDIIHKTAGEQRHLWIRYDRVLAKRPTPGNGSPQHEEPLYVTQTVEDSGGSDQATMYTLTDARWVWWRGTLWLRATVKAGTTGTNYTAVLLVRTVVPGSTSVAQILETRIGIAVRDTRVS